MELRLEIAWDGKGDFDAWKKEVLASLADKLRVRFSGFGETVKLNTRNIEVRRGRTWGYDISLSPQKVGTNAAGGVILRGKFKLRPFARLLLGGLGGLPVFISCVYARDNPSSMYLPVLVAAGLYGIFRLTVWIDGDNREEVSSLVEAGGV